MLGIHIEESIGLTCGRKSHLDHHIVARTYLEGGHSVLGIGAFAQPVVDGFAETHTEIDNLVTCPTLTTTIAHKGIVVNRNNTSVASLVADGVLQVNDDTCVIAAFWEGETIECGTRSSCYLGLDVETVQYHAVIAGCHTFRLMTVLAGNTFAAEFHVFVGRHQADVAQVTTTGTAEVHLGKADNLLA